MTDAATADLVARFEACTLETLTHEDHVRVAYHDLARAPLPEVLATLPGKLRRYAASKGAPGCYHETITVAFICLIHERMATPPEPWPAFAARHPDLLDRDLLRRYYPPGVLASERARGRFLFPAPAFGSSR